MGGRTIAALAVGKEQHACVINAATEFILVMRLLWSCRSCMHPGYSMALLRSAVNHCESNTATERHDTYILSSYGKL